MKTSAEIRQLFLDFFASKGHQIVSSSPLVPGNDPTLLFTNAGMVQFKETFLGEESRPYSTATSVQRCVRAGGKHNDLENVGYTARHHTFFEMLGNFSFGDYFKKEAIHYAWEFLTEVCQLPPEKLWITVFEEDDEAAQIWLDDIKVSSERFSRIGAKDNFWSMGDTGPCGPCTEIFYDHGDKIPGGPPGTPEEDGDRYIEIWNLVFMQYDRSADGTLNPLPKPSVDTGMGLERLAAILQGRHGNYEIDLFQNLIKATANLADSTDLKNPSLKVIADHIRSCAFLVVDGVVPSNEGRGYVLRRIIRRAIRHGHNMGIRSAFLHKLVSDLEREMGAAYPELTKAKDHVVRVLLQEEDRFAETLEHGMNHLEEALSGLNGDTIPGEILFKLYDTYGFPVDLTADIARERQLKIDMEGFAENMQRQKEIARAASRFGLDSDSKLIIDGHTEFSGYRSLIDDSTVTALFKDGEAVDSLVEGEQGIVVLQQSPFYAESGGQTGDSGLLRLENGEFQVRDTQKQGSAILHIGVVSKGSIGPDQSVECRVSENDRRNTATHHSVTHLLHAALRKVLGDHVQQKGSMVCADNLRFDFSHFEAVSNEQRQQIETMVNEQILLNRAVVTELCDIETAKSKGAMALFGEKYGDEVRVVSMGDFSMELCGGTHVARSGDIGLFKLISEAGVAAGVRRIEAVAGRKALDWVKMSETVLQQLAGQLRGSRDNLVQKLTQLQQQNREQERELQQLKAKLASSQGSDLASKAQDIDGIKVLAARLEGVDPKALRDTMDQLKNKLQQAAIVLAVVQGEKVSLVAGVTKAESKQIHAGNMLKMVAEQIGGKGGGRPDMAQGGGSQPENLDSALASVESWVKDQSS